MIYYKVYFIFLQSKIAISRRIAFILNAVKIHTIYKRKNMLFFLHFSNMEAI